MQQIGNGPHSEADAEKVVEPEATFDSQFDPEDLEPRPLRLPNRKRMAFVLCVVLGLIMAIVFPPLINMNHFRKQTASSISASLGRPVHMDSLTLNLLPMPGFTLTNFVVSEDPSFDSEPVIRAETVRARLRISSLWRRRVEFSRISLDDASVNLVHRADGRWNIESILLQASRIAAAPTAQQRAGDAPRFPYIEATSARLNVKSGLEKLPISLTEAEFALWLPQPNQWRLRLEGHPTRTDGAAADTGVMRVQGTLGKASSLTAVPVDLTGDWTAAPLGAVSEIVLGQDAGFRGDMDLHVRVSGAAGANTVESKLILNGLRRTEFVPPNPLNVDLDCRAQATEIFHQLSELHCGWGGLTIAGSVKPFTRPLEAVGQAVVAAVPANDILGGLRLVSRRISPDLVAGGTVSGKVSCCAGVLGDFVVERAALRVGEARPFVDSGDVTAHFGGGALTVAPFPVDLGGAAPATLDVRVNSVGYRMLLSGLVLRSRLMQLAEALPQFGDGLEAVLPAAEAGPVRVDWQAARGWSGGQVWSQATPAPVRRRRRGR